MNRKSLQTDSSLRSHIHSIVSNHFLSKILNYQDKSLDLFLELFEHTNFHLCYNFSHKYYFPFEFHLFILFSSQSNLSYSS
jgi:hypothetical protein